MGGPARFGHQERRYVKKPFLAAEDAFASGEVDIAMAFVVPMIPRIDAGHPIVVLGGVHVGCVEVFATERHVILNTLTDRPWSQYFCCMIVGNRDFVRRHPIATKRAMRAILKASELCALQPERVAKFLVDKAYVERSDYAVPSMKEVVYGKWREYDAADAVRFYSLRLHEAGMIKSSPQKILPWHRLAFFQRVEEGAEGVETSRDDRLTASLKARRHRPRRQRTVADITGE